MVEQSESYSRDSPGSGNQPIKQNRVDKQLARFANLTFPKGPFLALDKSA